MEIVIATPELDGPGGVQTYVLTIAPQLERLGHDVTLFCDTEGSIAQLARSRGLRVACGEAALPPRVDAVYSQTTPVALRMAERFPGATRVIAVHGAELDVHLPVGLDGVASAAVVMNDVTERRVGAMARPLPTLRLRQPVDFTAMTAGARARTEPRSVLALGNYLQGAPRARMIEVCDELGLTWTQIGGTATPAIDPMLAIARADVVIGIGRSILDAMSGGRPAWVYGPGGGDGWVTQDSYAAMEADGFRGMATGFAPDAQAFRRGMAAYDPALGDVARTIVVGQHSPYDHSVALSRLLHDTPPVAPPDAPLRELARLIRTAHDHQVRCTGLRGAMQVFQAEAEEAHEQVRIQRAALLAELEDGHRERDALRAELEVARADLGVARAQRWALLETRRWRMLNRVLAPLDRLRGR